MAKTIFRIWKPEEYQKAGPTDLIEMIPLGGQNALFLQKQRLEQFVHGIVHQEFIHLSGPTGSAKTTFIEAICLEPRNFTTVAAALTGRRDRLPRLFPIEMAMFESPGELYQRRALKEGTTYDEPSPLVTALLNAEACFGDSYPVIWLREMGRVHSSSVQGGLLDLMHKGPVALPNGRRIDGTRLTWVADSNYQAERDSTHTLVVLDDALRRRFTLNLTMDYLPAEQEVLVLENLVAVTNGNGSRNGVKIDREIIEKVVKLGQAVRTQKAEGNLQSVPPPTIYGYLAFLRMYLGLTGRSLLEIATATFLGNASVEDHKMLPVVFNEVFGLEVVDEDYETGGILF